MKMSTLNNLLQEQIKDAYSAETQLLDALPRMRDAADDATLKQAFDDHLQQTFDHVSRLKELCEKMSLSPLGHECKAMHGLIEEGSEVVDDKNSEPAVRDAALICAAQKVEHYEMALYGCLAAYARMLSHETARETFEKTLEEERAADAKLTEIAELWVNAAAGTDR
ncbi:MAG: ferritin-like domain-containing protein [Planctomycetota bacterium]|nr:ferritin-like domain-containing protein [Planctomycetota bacterium]